jgi:hypothetical protein
MSTKTVTFRPSIDAQALRKIAKETHYDDLSQFINDAIKEKVEKEAVDPKVRKFISKVSEAAFEYMGWKFSFPKGKEAEAIRHGVAEMKSGKVKTISSKDLIKHLKTS